MSVTIIYIVHYWFETTINNCICTILSDGYCLLILTYLLQLSLNSNLETQANIECPSQTYAIIALWLST